MWLQYLIVILNAATLQGSVLWWICKHICHHAETDTPRDVHSRKLFGFFHSHFGWMISKSCLAPAPKKYYARFLKHRNGKYAVLWWQARNYWWLAPLMAFGVPTAVCSLWGDPLGGFLVGGCTRLIVQWHTTWAINSITHKGDDARNVWWLVFLTVGEGYHKNHHDKPLSYRFGKWDLSAYLIEFFVWCGWGTIKTPA